MCGICGISYSSPGRPVERERLLQMRDTLAHRGPDGAGEWIHGATGLGHRRLSIIDLAGGHEPLSNETGTVWVTFNGEIYNYRELTNELVALGHHFKTKTDTEVLVHGYEEFGLDFFSRLNGMFVFALYDIEQQRLVLARDQLGVKPLFYAVTDEGLFYGSEIKAVIAGSGMRACTTREALQEYLIFRYIAGTNTFYRGVKRLPPGHTLVWQNGEAKCHEYWHPPLEDTGAKLRDAVAELDEHLERSVAMQLMSDVPLGSFCSGGVDSGLVTYYGALAHEGPLDTFSVGFEDAAWDETALALENSRSAGTRHHTLIMRPEEFGALLPRLVRSNDEPLSHPNSVPLYLLSRFAREHVTVVLTGEGADELFGGYPRYQIARIHHGLRKVSASVRSSVASAAKALPGHRGKRAGDLLEMDYMDALIFNSAYVHPKLVSRLTGSDVGGALVERRNELDKALRPDDPVGSLSRYELRTYLCCALERMDRMSMASGLEGRVPFLDVPLVEWAVKLGSELKVAGRRNKRLVKALAAARLHPTVVHGRKSGFGVPLDAWFRSDTSEPLLARLNDPNHPALEYFDRAMVHAVMRDHRSGRQNHGEVIWMLLNTFLWYEGQNGATAHSTAGELQSAIASLSA